MYRNLNINPLHRRADDCTVRAIAKVLENVGKTYIQIYALKGLDFTICLVRIMYGVHI